MNQRIVSYSISSFCVCLLVFSPVSTFWRGLSSDLTAFQGTECQNWQSNRLYGWHPWDWASLCPQCVWRCWAALLRLVNWQPYALLLIREFPRGLHKGPVKWRKKNTCQSLLQLVFTTRHYFPWPKANFFVVFTKTTRRQSSRNWTFTYDTVFGVKIVICSFYNVGSNQGKWALLKPEGTN